MTVENVKAKIKLPRCTSKEVRHSESLSLHWSTFYLSCPGESEKNLMCLIATWTRSVFFFKVVSTGMRNTPTRESVLHLKEKKLFFLRIQNLVIFYSSFVSITFKFSLLLNKAPKLNIFLIIMFAVLDVEGSKRKKIKAGPLKNLYL